MEYWFIGTCILIAGYLFYAGAQVIAVAVNGLKETVVEDTKAVEHGIAKIETYIKEITTHRKGISE